MSAASASIASRASFGFIRYGSVWEDADVLCRALAPAAAGGRVLSIASAGDNVLALLTLDPAEVLAVDLSAAQLACLELRLAAFRRLDDAELHAFLGVLPSACRLATWEGLRGQVSAEARAFWDANLALLDRGAAHAGKFERYLHGFGRWILPLVHSRRTIRALREARDPEERARFYDERWDTPAWRAMFRVFFSRAVMGRLGRDPQFFAHVEGTVGERILARTRHALRDLPTRDNPYLASILTGTWPPEARPRYLRPEHSASIRARLDRVRLLRGPIQEAPGAFDAFNLSDIFEYMGPAEHEACYRAVVEKARPGARLAYWNMLAPRSRPESLAGRVRPLAAEAAALHREDRAWFYQAFHVDEVTP